MMVQQGNTYVQPCKTLLINTVDQENVQKDKKKEKGEFT